MPCNPHYREMINSGWMHICDSGMAKIMEPEILNSCRPTSTIKGSLNRIDRLPLRQEDKLLLKIPDFIQVLQQTRQFWGEGDYPILISLGICCPKLNKPHLNVHTFPSEVENFPQSHPSLIGAYVHPLEMGGGSAVISFPETTDSKVITSTIHLADALI